MPTQLNDQGLTTRPGRQMKRTKLGCNINAPPVVQLTPFLVSNQQIKKASHILCKIIIVGFLHRLRVYILKLKLFKI
jgi:hypothetical protein